jgi:hypothetical protein
MTPNELDLLLGKLDIAGTTGLDLSPGDSLCREAATALRDLARDCSQDDSIEFARALERLLREVFDKSAFANAKQAKAVGMDRITMSVPVECVERIERELEKK